MAAEFRRLSENLGAILGRVNCGILISGKKAAVIDTGIDPDFGRRILSIMAENSLEVSAILTTHAHSDHFSGNAIIAERTGSKVFCPRVEADTLRFPELEGHSLWGMAKSPKGTRNKHLMGVPSPVDFEISGEGPIQNLGLPAEAVSLPGHSFNQMGYLSEGTLFAGDAFFSGETLEKHKLLFCSDISSAISSLGKIRALHSSGKVSRIVPGHGEIVEGGEIPRLLDLNEKGLLEASRIVLSFADSRTAEEMVEEYASSIGQKFSLTQYFLHLTIFKAHLTYLEDSGEAICEISDNRLLWKKTP